MILIDESLFMGFFDCQCFEVILCEFHGRDFRIPSFGTNEF